MTTPRYPALPGCSEWSQVYGDASYAWAVNFNNGNNRFRVRAVRSSRQCQGVTFLGLYDAWERARKRKIPSHNQFAFESHLIDNLIDLEERISKGEWKPSPTTCFIAQRPKAREIHAPDFGDRVVHHAIVPVLEAQLDPTFIEDSYAGRKGKGTHAAVNRVRTFARQVESGQGGGWYLQLDIRNFFNSIDRRILWTILKPRMERAGIALEIQRVVHALLATSAQQNGVVHRSTGAERAQVPPHKRLENARQGCGLPIGNLSSQFFANVFLNEFDQFVKHVLKAKRYVRYVDDFVLVHQDRAQLELWLDQIRAFLRDRLNLDLKDDIRLRPLQSGIDFLGYVVYPTHTRVRRRVVAHAREAMSQWATDHVKSNQVHASPADLQKLQSIWGCYEGHFRHASTQRLREGLLAKYAWLSIALKRRRFDYREDDVVKVLNH